MPFMTHYKLFFDGSCGPKNPGGTAAYGYALWKEGGDEPSSGSGIIGTGPRMSNNLAEFSALYEGLARFAELGDPKAVITVLGDSKLVINVMNRFWRAKSDKLYFDAYKLVDGIVRHLRKEGAVITFDWIPREQNTYCDTLSKADEKK
jgi:ribonuclease HI